MVFENITTVVCGNRDISPLQTNPVIRLDWDINDTVVPIISNFDNFNEWPDDHCRFVYSDDDVDAKKHASGWAMRNTNNHNNNILKKSCLGVLICSAKCKLSNGGSVNMRPAICDKARAKQQGKQCPNRDCNGVLQIKPCKGHGGYPVTHFWRGSGKSIFFQSKGNHDHERPEAKGSSLMRRMYGNGRRGRGGVAATLARDAALKQKLSTLRQPSYKRQAIAMDDCNSQLDPLKKSKMSEILISTQPMSFPGTYTAENETNWVMQQQQPQQPEFSQFYVNSMHFNEYENYSMNASTVASESSNYMPQSVLSPTKPTAAESLSIHQQQHHHHHQQQQQQQSQNQPLYAQEVQKWMYDGSDDTSSSGYNSDEYISILPSIYESTSSNTQNYYNPTTTNSFTQPQTMFEPNQINNIPTVVEQFYQNGNTYESNLQQQYQDLSSISPFYYSNSCDDNGAWNIQFDSSTTTANQHFR